MSYDLLFDMEFRHAAIEIPCEYSASGSFIFRLATFVQSPHHLVKVKTRALFLVEPVCQVYTGWYERIFILLSYISIRH